MTTSPAPHSFNLNAPIPARLIRATAASWTKEREREARRKGYEVRYSFEDGFVSASYFNGPIFCYSREWTP